MFQPHLVARYLFFVLAIDGAHVLKTVPQSMYSPLSLQCACNPSMNAVPTWWHNDMVIKQRKGKHIPRSATLYILDLRRDDSGMYTCIFTGPANVLHKCAGYNISVVDPTARSSALHERTAPADPATERSGEVYWHPKMKQEDGQHVFMDQPVTLEVFIYSSGSTKPIVQWFGPIDHSDTAPFISESRQPQKFDCNSPEETQRVLNGTCYRASYTIHRLPAGAEFMCVVKSCTLTNASVLQTNFIVYESFKVIEDPHPISECRRPRFEALAVYDIADLILQVLDHNATEPTEPTKPTFTSTESPNISSSLHPPVLNFASLRPAEIPDLHFFLLSPTACLRGNLTLHCQLPGLASELEVWYLGPKLDHFNRSSHCLLDGCFDVDPVFIRRSGQTLFKLRSDSGPLR